MARGKLQTSGEHDGEEVEDDAAAPTGNVARNNAQVAAILRTAEDERPTIEDVDDPEPAKVYAPDAVELDLSGDDARPGLGPIDPVKRAEKLRVIAARQQAMQASQGPTLTVTPSGTAMDPEQTTATRDASMTAVRAGIAAIKPGLDKALASASHKPPLQALMDKVSAQYKSSNLEEAQATLADLTALVTLVTDHDNRFASVVRRAAAMPTEGKFQQMGRNMAVMIPAYLAKPWAEQIDRSGLADLEGRLLKYQESIATDAERTRLGAAGQAAARAENRIGSNGVVIDKKPKASFGVEERGAIQAALDVAAGIAVRNWGGKWAESHGNIEGNLPGAGGYLEYYVRPGPGHDAPGPRRLVRKPGSARWYYSNTHYGESGKPAFWVLS